MDPGGRGHYNSALSRCHLFIRRNQSPANSLLQDLGLPPSAMDMTWPFIVFLLIFALTMPLAGPYIQKMGPKKVSTVGGALVGIGWIAASFSSSPIMLAILYGVIGGVGVGIAYGCPIAVSAQWFPDKRGLAVGLTVLGFGFSAALIAPISDFLVANYGGVMSALKIFGIAFLIITVVLSQFLMVPPLGWCPTGWKAPAPKPGAAAKIDFMRNEMSKNKTFYGLWLCYTIGALAGLTAIGIAKPVGLEVAANAGMAVAAAGILMTSLTFPFALCNGLGRPIFGTLTDKLTPRNAAMITYVLIIVACLMLYTNYASVTMYTIAFALLWGCLGGWLAIAPTATASFFGMRITPRTMAGLHGLRDWSSDRRHSLCSSKGHHGRLSALLPYRAALAVLGIVISFLLMKPPVRRIPHSETALSFFFISA